MKKTSYVIEGANDYYNQVMSEAEHIILSSELLHQLKDLKTDQLHYFFSQLYYFVDLFPSFLGALICKSSSWAVRFALIDNLVDEGGGFEKIQNRDFSATHAGMLRKFVEELTTSNVGVAQKSVHMQILIEQFNRLFIHGSFVEAMAAMASMESLSVNWFHLIYSQLQQRHQFSEDDLFFFKLHMVIDEEHSSILKVTLLPLLTTQENNILLKQGAMAAVSIWNNFYDQIAKEMNLQLGRKTSR